MCNACLLCVKIGDYWPYDDKIISNYILFVDYEKVKFYIWFFERKVSNDLEVNTSGATLPTTNVEENLDVPMEQNFQTKFQKVDMSLLQLELDPRLRRQIYTY